MAQAQFFKWVRKDLETGEDFEVLYQMALRPSVWGTWELIFPKECLGTMLCMLGYNDKKRDIYPNIKKGLGMMVLRTYCGVKKIPVKAFKEASEIPESLTIKDSWRGLHHLKINGVAVHLIGIREDKEGEMFDPDTGKTYYQELL